MHRNSDSAPARSRDADDLPPTQEAAGRLAADREAALTELYVRVTPAIHAYAALRLGERWVGPEDIVAEVWCRVSERLGDYDSNRPFRGWVFGFAQRVVKEAQRRVARGIASVGRGDDSRSSSLLGRIPASATSASVRAARNEDLDRFLDWARHELSEYEREVLLLRGIQGRALLEAAMALGRSERAVTVCWARVLEKIRRRSAPDGVLDAEA